MHPRLRWSRSVRAKRALLMAQNQRQQLWQRAGRRRNKKGRKTKKRGGKGKGNMYNILRYIWCIENKSSSPHTTSICLLPLYIISVVAHTPPAFACCSIHKKCSSPYATSICLLSFYILCVVAHISPAVDSCLYT